MRRGVSRILRILSSSIGSPASTSSGTLVGLAHNDSNYTSRAAFGGRTLDFAPAARQFPRLPPFATRTMANEAPTNPPSGADQSSNTLARRDFIRAAGAGAGMLLVGGSFAPAETP